MSARVDLTELGDALKRQYAGARPALTVRLANDNQLLTVLPAERGPDATVSRPFKEATHEPPRGKAFELYVAAETPDAAALTQRMAPPVQTNATFVLKPGVRKQMWTLAAPGGDHVVVRLHMGEDMSTEEAQRLLDTVHRLVLP